MTNWEYVEFALRVVGYTLGFFIFLWVRRILLGRRK